MSRTDPSALHSCLTYNMPHCIHYQLAGPAHIIGKSQFPAVHNSMHHIGIQLVTLSLHFALSVALDYLLLLKHLPMMSAKVKTARQQLLLRNQALMVMSQKLLRKLRLQARTWQKRLLLVSHICMVTDVSGHLIPFCCVNLLLDTVAWHVPCFMWQSLDRVHRFLQCRSFHAHTAPFNTVAWFRHSTLQQCCSALQPAHT